MYAVGPENDDDRALVDLRPERIARFGIGVLDRNGDGARWDGTIQTKDGQIMFTSVDEDRWRKSWTCADAPVTVPRLTAAEFLEVSGDLMRTHNGFILFEWSRLPRATSLTNFAGWDRYVAYYRPEAVPASGTASFNPLFLQMQAATAKLELAVVAEADIARFSDWNGRPADP